MTDDNPAETVELTTEDADTALMTKYEYRHGLLDGYAEMYQHALSLLVSLHENPEAAEAVLGDDWEQLANRLDSLTDDIAEHVLEHEEHGVRWTLDRYDDIPRDPDKA